MSKRAYLWARTLCHYAGETEEFLADFWERLQQSEKIYEEFMYFLDHEKFSCAYSIDGCTVIDIMIWQMDHFKAYMDRETQVKGNQAEMVLRAFDTFLKMEEEPEAILYLLDTESGSDYDGKF